MKILSLCVLRRHGANQIGRGHEKNAIYMICTWSKLLYSGGARMTKP